MYFATFRHCPRARPCSGEEPQKVWAGVLLFEASSCGPGFFTSDKLKATFEAQAATISDKPFAELPGYVSQEISIWAQIAESTGAAVK